MNVDSTNTGLRGTDEADLALEDPALGAALQPSERVTQGGALASLQALLERAQRPQDSPPPRYRLIRELGQGGMGTVWLASDDRLDREVAIKRLTSLAPDALGRLGAEAQAIAQVSDANVVEVFDIDIEGHPPQIVMEYVRGLTLRAYAERNPGLGWRAWVRIYEQAGRGLRAAHALGLVHRDFKPDNAIIDERGVVKVLDFGLARARRAESSSHPCSDENVVVTRDAGIVGTLAYMSSQQGDGDPAHATDDVFAFSVSLWEALYGARPFLGRDFDQLQHSKAKGPPSQPSRRGVPRRVHAVLARGLASHQADRWSSMDAMLGALGSARGSRHRKWWWLGPTALAAGGGVLLTQAPSPRPCASALEHHDEEWKARRGEVAATLRVPLDAYAAQWSAAYEAACASSREALQMQACLHAEHVQVFGDADAPPNPSAIPTESWCSNPERMWIDLPPWEHRAELRRLEGHAQYENEALCRGDGRTAGVLDELTRAREIGYRPTIASLLYVSARVDGLYREQPIEAREELLLESVRLAEVSGATRVAVRSAAALAELNHRGGNAREDSETWLRYAYAALENIEPRGDALVHVATAHAVILLEQGDPFEALDVVDSALERLPDDTNLQYSSMLEERRASALYGVGRRRDSAEQFRGVLARAPERGTAPGLLADQLGNLGIALHRAGEVDEALVVFERQLAVLDSLDLEPAERASDEINIARALALRPRSRPTAIERLRKVLGVSEVGTDTHARAAYSLGEALEQDGDLLGAAEAFQAAQLSVDLVFGPDSSHAADLTASLAGLGDPDSASF
ncbi:MAG: protein kinase [Nannocystaceae bacterium]|nr:protein kinase [Nannocystaceae bacterium]